MFNYNNAALFKVLVSVIKKRVFSNQKFIIIVVEGCCLDFKSKFILSRNNFLTLLNSFGLLT